MKIKSLILAMAACAGLFSACSNDLTDEMDQKNDPTTITGDAYASFSFVMPNGSMTRAANTEVGTDAENIITSANVYLFQEGKCVQIEKVLANDLTPNKNNTQYTTNKIKVNRGTYNVYLIVNPTSSVNTNVGATFENFLNTVENAGQGKGEYCTDKNFMMTNADPKADVEVTAANTEDNPAHAVINVERIAAKITFTNTKMTFDIKDRNNQNKIGNVTFDAFKVINTKSNAYNFRKVGTSQADAAQGAKENGNYVIENFFDSKSSTFNETIFKNNYSRRYDSYVAFRALDGDGNQTLAYCLENTMKADAQIEGYTTTVILRAKATITGVNDAEDTKDKDLYEYNNKFYTGLKALVADNADFVKQNKVDQSQSDEEFLNSLDSQKALAAVGVKFYTQGYCYYNVKLRHNDNGDPEVMGAMEFVIVRNNVYKLQVNSVAQIGDTNSHTPGQPDPNDPTIGEPDNNPENPNPEIPGTVVPDPNPNKPDTFEPIEPETPDEEKASYLDVEINILEWTVRSNEVDL